MAKLLNSDNSFENGMAYDPVDDMLGVRSTQKKFRDAFSSASIDTTKWKVVQTGSGATVSQSGGVLSIATGTTASAETIIESLETFTIPFRGMFGIMLSQRIANQEFYLEMVSVDPITGATDDKNSASWQLTGTTSTTGYYQVGSGGMARLTSGGATIASTASYAIKEIECFADETWFHDRAMDSTSGRTASWVRHQQIPDPNQLYKVRIRAKNLSTAPASTTTMSLQYITVIDYAELTTEITASRGASSAGMSMPVQVANSPTVYANLQAYNGIGVLTTTNLGASATYTASSQDGGTSPNYNSYRVMIAHTAGSTPAHLVFEQSTDNTTFRETHRVPIPSDGQYRTFEFPWMARYVRCKVINGSVAQTLMFLQVLHTRIDGSFDTDKTLTFVNSTTALGANATFTGTTLNLGSNHSINRHRAVVYADQAGTLYFDQSRDGTNWRTTKSQAFNIGDLLQVEDNITMQYVRVRYVNGATAQTAFDFSSALIRQ
ncbi:hypothetical protein V7094_25925 [Priestia megaterium]|uniref:hypothetical protein n=1 Tax=Priestia megaterium TaxID=1404 RepID=UPI003000DB3F